jgi:hypothetical protein
VKHSLDPRSVIQENAKRIAELRASIPLGYDEFRRQHNALAFPGGYTAGIKKIQAGDIRAIEEALVFLEVRPYFFRSQYIRTKLTRLLKHAQLTARQTERLQRALEADKKGE